MFFTLVLLYSCASRRRHLNQGFTGFHNSPLTWLSPCTVGFVGIRLFFDKKASDADEARALSHATDHIDIYSNSWGPDDRGFSVTGPGPLTQRVLEHGANKVQ